ncbi:MAG TPA: hypothetical protein V6C89_03325 [Drouetiella sp.]|jgi:hypothetical protein
MTSQRVENVVDASCGFLCGFFFMAFATLKGHLSDVAFIGSVSALSLCFGFSLIQHVRRMPACDKNFSFAIGALVPLCSLLFYCMLRAISSYNPEPKPIWMLVSLAMSLGVVATRSFVSIVPSLFTTVNRSLSQR